MTSRWYMSFACVLHTVWDHCASKSSSRNLAFHCIQKKWTSEPLRLFQGGPIFVQVFKGITILIKACIRDSYPFKSLFKGFLSVVNCFFRDSYLLSMFLFLSFFKAV